MATKHLDPKLFDRRTLELNISRGALKKSDYEKFLHALPDDEGNYESVLVDEDELTQTLSWADDENEEPSEE